MENENSNQVNWGEVNCDELIEEYKLNGYVVVPILTEEEVWKVREEFHREMDIDHDKTLAGDAEAREKVGGVRAKCAASTIFYPKWKLDVCSHPKVIDFFERLMRVTFGPANLPGYEHPLGHSDSLLLFLDGCAYRLPDHIQAEGGLGLHLDRNPYDPYLQHPAVTKKLIKYRPVQCWLGLTDHYGGESGGLRVVRGFHKEHDAYFGKTASATGESAGGEFYRLNPNSHAKLWSRAQPVDVPAGCMVLWDNRLPHSTCEKLVSFDSREVLYFSYLPATALNKDYCEQQKLNLFKGLPPPQFLDRRPDGKLTRDWEIDDLSPKQKSVLCITSKDNGKFQGKK